LNSLERERGRKEEEGGVSEDESQRASSWYRQVEGMGAYMKGSPSSPSIPIPDHHRKREEEEETK